MVAVNCLQNDFLFLTPLSFVIIFFVVASCNKEQIKWMLFDYFFLFKFMAIFHDIFPMWGDFNLRLNRETNEFVIEHLKYHITNNVWNKKNN